MNNVQEIDVTLHPDGRVEVKVRGVPGDACLELTRGLEQYLGDHILSREATDEMHQTSDLYNEDVQSLNNES